MKLLFASNNSGKIKEVGLILKDTNFELIGIKDLTEVNPRFSSLVEFDVPEKGKTYQQNALLKAKFFAKRTNLLTCADDSGLEIQALDDFPGVNSKRWFKGTDEARNRRILKKLKNEKDRFARFVTVVCLYDPHTQEAKYFRGEVSGKIIDAESGNGEDGFGYDPLFIPEGYDQTFAQLGVEKKNKLSHRYKAFVKLKDYLLEKHQFYPNLLNFHS